MRPYALSVDDEADTLLGDLALKFGKTSKAPVLRMAIALLKFAAEAQERGDKIIIVDKNGVQTKELAMPEITPIG